MPKLSAIVAALAVLLLAGCANQLSGTGASGPAPADAWRSPVPEQPGYNRWNTPIPPG